MWHYKLNSGIKPIKCPICVPEGHDQFRIWFKGCITFVVNKSDLFTTKEEAYGVYKIGLLKRRKKLEDEIKTIDNEIN